MGHCPGPADLTGNTQFSFAAFIAGAFTSAIPGIILQLVAIPVVVVALQKARLIPPDRLTPWSRSRRS